MTGKISYKSSVRRDLKQIDPSDVRRLIHGIGMALRDNPRSGEPLHGEFKGLFELRVGDCQVIYAMVDEDVLVLRIRHRSRAYG